MAKLKFIKSLLAIIAGTVILAFFPLLGAFSQEQGEGHPGYYNQRGMEYFNKGFYDHGPKNQKLEADRNYGLAVKEFRAAIAKDPSYTEAHRNLARVYFLQKKFDGAAEEYQRVTELAPDELDAYVNLALALIELKRLDQAIQALEKAKRQTSDPKAMMTLDSYLSKVRAYQAQEVR
jgi:tetratricopeptide (TPR) repeat protein